MPGVHYRSFNRKRDHSTGHWNKNLAVQKKTGETHMLPWLFGLTPCRGRYCCCCLLYDVSVRGVVGVDVIVAVTNPLFRISVLVDI